MTIKLSLILYGSMFSELSCSEYLYLKPKLLQIYRERIWSTITIEFSNELQLMNDIVSHSPTILYRTVCKVLLKNLKLHI